MSGRTITWSSTLAVISCCDCGILFGVPEDFRQQCRDAGPKRSFWCPNGHQQHYTTTTADRLRRDLEAERRRREWAESARKAAQDQADSAHRSAAAYKGQVTRIRKRVGNGVCPCCHRTFQQLSAHMANKHPDYADGAS
jgi:hypothetical protein